ncbi:CDP-diacylglycerol--glycerol-3-phosphate 3-phosphatidyltransferase [Scheffersomyces spartinae]|uniref:CDP-diacylglycerol--glycerol-3-phosphate 3-phosphatidyltransferase n=1 Tax=Scheffersomyces spartinae TaxID=45513 RepID=A0A9P7V9T7_9ASCO|nr:CDP-diacylglycerol--glycerol-3-phosphate 3-phosphatidyltransferase [Scheffersomyces spartinae]KAG7194003.1 CDP-diacylglycerol--glycerol-3-phosphate 3-phosphatidyltransferase [Scheffersomyces spartinae]
MIHNIYNYFFTRATIAKPLASSGTTTARNYSTNNPVVPPKTLHKFHPRLQSIIQQLDGIAPRFPLNKGDIDIITHPEVFYECLKEKIKGAQKRVFLSSLYIGKAQTELASTIEEALSSNDQLKVHILTDCLRGTRESPHKPLSASMLVKLVEKFGKHRVDIRMYHTPHLHGLTKSLAPRRINEGWGLQHMKLYGFDDEIILSGANLSQDYFTDRQDRYYLFKNKPLTDYYFNIQKAVSLISYQLVGASDHMKKTLKLDFRLDWPSANKSCEPHLNIQRFLIDLSYLLEPLLKQQDLGTFEEYDDTHEFDTLVYPISQFTPLMNPQRDHSTEKPAILRILLYLDSPKIKWWFTAGYFNMHPEIQERLLNGAAEGKVITASPLANSFYKSTGVSYYLPEAYLLLAKNFLDSVNAIGKQSLIKVYEWKNGVVNTPGGWSYHAKGLWVTVPDENEPSISVIGSSNYTKRAYLLDLETNAIVVTKDPELKKAMKGEIDNIMEHALQLNAEDFTEEKGRKLSSGVKWAVKLVGDKL